MRVNRGSPTAAGGAVTSNNLDDTLFGLEMIKVVKENICD